MAAAAITTAAETQHASGSLHAVFNPKSIAVVGASDKEGSVGRQLMANLLGSGFDGPILPINSSHARVAGLEAFPSIAAVTVPLDLVIIAVPAESVPAVVEECAAAGVKGAVIISAGFRETGAEGAALEERIRRTIARTPMRIIGPNCLGILNPHARLNATFSQVGAKPGRVAFLSQSGALCTAVLDWSLRENIGFSAFVSTGSMLNVGWGDLLDWFAEDPHTESILLYMESAGDSPQSLISAAREAALKKPLIVIKAGRSNQAARAAISHTGAIVGSDRVIDAVFRRCGVLRVSSIGELFSMAELLGKQPRPKGRRLGIVTNAGGPGLLAVDALLAGGGELARISDLTIAALDKQLPKHWSHGNPIDVLGDASPERFSKAAHTVMEDSACDAALLILAPQGMTNPAQTAQEIIRSIPGDTTKPVLASWMGGDYIATGRSLLNRHGVATFPFPDSAAAAFNLMWRYDENLRALYETPLAQPGLEGSSRQIKATEIIKRALVGGRTLLTEYESKQLIALYEFPVIRTELALNEAEAVSVARLIGFPAVLKVHSYTVTHKSDVGGVELELVNEDAVRTAYRRIQAAVQAKMGGGHFQGVTVQPMVSHRGYELIMGSSVDPQFGPVLLFGAGGKLAEILEDHELGLPPLTSVLAQRMIERTRIYKALRGTRGQAPIDLAELAALLVRLGDLVTEVPRIKEVDLNPVLAAPGSISVLDARIALHDPSLPDQQLPKPAIRPCPAYYTYEDRLKDGTAVRFRPVRAEDEPLVRAFEEQLSPENVYLRYFASVSLDYRTSHNRLVPLCFCDYGRAITLLATTVGPAGEAASRGQGEPVIGIATLRKIRGANEAELALQVADSHQNRGIGSHLMSRMLEIAKEEAMHALWMAMLAENGAMLHLAQKFGFALTVQDSTVFAKLPADTSVSS